MNEMETCRTPIPGVSGACQNCGDTLFPAPTNRTGYRHHRPETIEATLRPVEEFLNRFGMSNTSHARHEERRASLAGARQALADAVKGWS